MAHWAQQLNKRSNGKVEVKTFPGGTLLGAKDMYDGVTKGVADIGLGSPSYDPGRFPLTSGVALPVGFTSATQASKTLWALTKEFKPKEYEGFKVIAMFTTEPGFIQSKTAVKNAADLAGMKLRAAGTGVPVLKALGAAPIGMPMPEVPQSVSTGVINGTMTSREVLQDFKLAESLKFVTDYPTVVVAFAAVMDQKKWDKLPADVKKVIEELAEEMPGWTGNYHDNENVGAAMAWAQKDHKLQVVSLAADEKARWDAKLKSMEDDWVKEMSGKGLPAAAYLKRLHELAPVRQEVMSSAVHNRARAAAPGGLIHALDRASASAQRGPGLGRRRAAGRDDAVLGGRHGDARHGPHHRRLLRGDRLDVGGGDGAGPGHGAAPQGPCRHGAVRGQAGARNRAAGRGGDGGALAGAVRRDRLLRLSLRPHPARNRLDVGDPARHRLSLGLCRRPRLLRPRAGAAGRFPAFAGGAGRGPEALRWTD
jgi:TRAP-type C4-dicarboxylate transport system substrate-binding protein